MSHGALHPGQFGEQLKMFMTPQELIDTADKADTRIAAMPGGPEPTPREQWEHPLSGEKTSLRDERRQANAAQSGRSFEEAPPVALFHGGSSGRLRLSDGHHRLAHAEEHGIPFIAVEHHFPKSWK
jgi:hypothetical protein